MREKTLPEGLRGRARGRGGDGKAGPACRRRLTPYYFYAPLASGAVAAAASASAPEAAYVIVLVALGLLSWGLFEYAVHRFVLHRDPGAAAFALPGNETHLAHHADPEALDRLYVPLREGAPIAAAYYVAAWGLTASWQAAAYLFAGLILGYLLYEWLDYEAHHGRSRSRLMRYYRKYHLQHHYLADDARYGVTSPLFDLLFGTYRITRRQGRPARTES